METNKTEFDAVAEAEANAKRIRETMVSYGPRCWWCANLLNGKLVCCKPEDRLD